MKITPAKSVLAGAALAIVAACSSATIACACTLPPPMLAASGIVTTSAGTPVGGARIHARVMTGDCADASAAIVPQLDARPQTEPDGRYLLRFQPVHGTAQQCVRIIAERAPRDTAVSEPIIYEPNAQSPDPTPRDAPIVFP